MSQRVTPYRQRVVERALRGPGLASTSARQAAFDNQDVDPRAAGLVDAVARHAWRIEDDDVAVPRAKGMSEDEIFELTICAALGQATRQLEAALAALEAALRPDSGPAAGAPGRQGDGGLP